MSLGHLSYLITIFIFAGTAVLIEWSLGFRELKKFLKIVMLSAATGIIATFIAEPIALRWQSWSYNPQRILNIFIGGAALETYGFATLVAIAISSATLIWSDWEDERLPLIKTLLYKLRKKFRKKISQRF